MKNTSYFDEKLRKWYLWKSKQCCFTLICGKNSDKNAEKTQETKSKILMAAFDEIFKSGFQAASLNTILNDTGITKGALYHHFNNKIELGYAVVDEVIRNTIYSHWIEPLKDTDDPITELQNIISFSGALMSEDDVRLGCPLNNLAQEMSPIDEGFRERIAVIYQEWQEGIEVALMRGVEAGKVDSSIDPKEVAVLFVASLQGCLGFAKSVQSLDSLMVCGKALMDRLESLRPTH